MEILIGLVTNKILITGLLSWAIAQVLKTIIYLAINKTLNLERLVGDGGMPSAHSATVTSVALSVGLNCSFSSPEFAIAAIMAIVVMHDAMGVRLETGKQAKAINNMMDLLNQLADSSTSPETKLKEFVGHTPMQVLAGFILGVAAAIISYNLF
ncbi:MAG: divergent PAP2 family protein [Lachnospiraceae bacterium]|nr:divergent PAP2 family protein [Lachnospiraceae bacterium]